MLDFLKNMSMLGAETLVVYLFLAAPLLLATLIAGYVGIRAIARARERRRQERREELALQKSLGEGKKKEKDLKKGQVYYSPKKGWLVESLPMGMTPRLEKTDSKELFIDACGIDKCIKATRGKGDEVTFTFGCSAKQAASLQEWCAGKNLPCSMTVLPDGSVQVLSPDAGCILSLAGVAFPQKEMKVEREVTSVREYCVSGVRSYEEAVHKLKTMEPKPQPDNIYNETKLTVGDKVFVDRDQDPLKASLTTLPAGTFIVCMGTRDTDTDLIRVPSSVKDGEDLKRFAGDQLQKISVHDSSRTDLSVTFDGTLENVSRFVGLEDGKRFDFVSRESVSFADEGLKAYAVLSSEQDFRSVLDDGVIKQGTFVSVGKERPEGKYVVEIGIADPETLSQFKVIEPLPAGVREAADRAGIDKEDFRLSHIRYEVAKDGYANSVTKSDISLGRAAINGVPLQEISDRLSNERLPALDGKGLETWIDDASQIESVDMKVDTRKNLLTVVSRVRGGSSRTDERPLTDSEIREFEKRGKISKAELKDLLMQTNPGYFESYRAVRSSASAPARSIYHDAVSDFITGHKPRLASESAGASKSVKKAEKARKAAGRSV